MKQGIKSVWCYMRSCGRFQLHVNFVFPLSNGELNRHYLLPACDLFFRILSKNKLDFGSHFYVNDLFGITDLGVKGVDF